MQISEIISEWENDCKIDKTSLDDETLKIPILHSKYLKELSLERIRLLNAKTKQKELHGTLFRYYKGELNIPAELKALNKEPWQHRTMKADLNTYIEQDKSWIDLCLKINLSEEKVKMLEAIMKSLENRSFQISNAINWQKLLGGK